MNEQDQITVKTPGKRRFTKLPVVFASIYLAWSLLVYFGTLGRNGHEWWPVMLYFIIWPFGKVLEFISSFSRDWFFNSNEVLNDYFTGALFIIGGTIWIWFVVTMLSKLLIRLVGSGSQLQRHSSQP